MEVQFCVERFVVGLAEEVVPSEGELLTPGQLAGADNTAEAVNVVGVAPNAHHQISLAEGQMALGALHAKQFEIVSLAVGLALAYEAGTALVEVLVTVGALQTGGVPLQIRVDAQNVLVVDLAAAANAQRDPGGPLAEAHATQVHRHGAAVRVTPAAGHRAGGRDRSVQVVVVVVKLMGTAAAAAVVVVQRMVMAVVVVVVAVAAVAVVMIIRPTGGHLGGGEVRAGEVAAEGGVVVVVVGDCFLNRRGTRGSVWRRGTGRGGGLRCCCCC